MGVGIFDPSKGARLTDRNLVNDKSTTKTKKNPIRDKSTKVKKKLAKIRNNLAIQIVKIPINHQKSKHNMREVTAHGKS